MLQTIKGLPVNEVSDEVKKYLEKNPMPDVVKYRLLNGTVNKDPKAVKGKDDILYPSNTQIVLKSRFIDPGTKQPVTIGKIKSFDEKQVTAWDVVNVLASNRGLIVLHKGVVEEFEMYDVFELLNENASNPFRDQSAPKLFERIDENKTAQRIVDAGKQRAKMYRYVDLMDDQELRIVHAANGGNWEDSPSVAIANLYQLIDKDATKFEKMVDDKSTLVKAIIKRAMEANVITFNPMTNQFSWTGGSVIATLDRKEGVDSLDLFAEWLDTSKTGEQVTFQMKKLINPEDPNQKKGDKKTENKKTEKPEADKEANKEKE